MADEGDVKHEKLESEVKEMNIKEEEDVDMDTIALAPPVRKERSVSTGGDTPVSTGTPRSRKVQSRSPVKVESKAETPDGEMKVKVEGEVEVKLLPDRPPLLQRKRSQKVERRAPQLFFDYENKTTEATSTFSLLTECTYANKYLGTTEHALECDCAEEWDSATRTNQACGEDSDCINRATKLECIADCGCGSTCQNQRFQRKEWANVSVIKTEKKGYGLRTETDLGSNDFIFEYIGEVIGENAFRKRMQNYDEEGIKHFYFMSLTSGEFVDATKRGNLGRFCNHSCNPNCYVDKWVVGSRLRMGIFSERKIQAGEELTFNYNVDRYGAEPQPCYCGESNCTGYIGGKTQTERGTKLSNTLIEALGIDDADAWDTAVAKRPKKKKASEDDEEYVNNVEPRGLDEEGVNKVMSSLMQCKEKWIAVKLLTRIQRAEDDKVRNRVVRFHGYRILKAALSNFVDDVNVCLQVLDVLDQMPRLTRNKIQDSKIEEAVTPLVNNEDERVAAQAKRLLESWSKLEVGYRIPRLKRDPNAVAPERKPDRDRRDGERRRSRSRSKSKSPERIQAPTGPRSNAAQRASAYYPGPRPPPRFRPPPPSGPLPFGWFEATAANGSVYYYNNANVTTWQRPTGPAGGAPPPPPSQAVTDQQILQNLINNIVSTKKVPVKPDSSNVTPADTPKKERKEEKWKSLPEEKQKKLYEATIQPHIMHVVGKYKHKLAKDDLKRWAKELAKQMVNGDFKKGRVEDPSKISDKQAKNVKRHAQEFFEKAVKKKEASEKKKDGKRVEKQAEGSHTPIGTPPGAAGSPMDKDDVDITLSDDEGDEPEATPAESLNSPTALKRRRDELLNGAEDDPDQKKLRMGDEVAPPPPPPPPPPAEPVAGDPMKIEQDIETFEENMANGVDQGAVQPVHNAAFEEEFDADDGLSVNKVATALDRPNSAIGSRGKFEPTQTATPPTTGSPDPEEAEKAVRRGNFVGMNPERMRQFGLFDGASE